MKIAVKDANILIDLANGGLVDAVLHLPYDFVTTDAEAVLHPEDESKFETVTYTYYEQLNGYQHLKQLDMAEGRKFLPE